MEDLKQAGFLHIYPQHETRSQRTGWYICWKHACFFIKYGTLYSLGEALLVISLALLTIGVYSFYYADKIIPTTELAGENISNLKQDELQQFIAQKLDSYEKNHPLTITTSEGSMTPTLQDLGVSINIKKTTESAFTNGHNGSVKQRLVDSLEILIFSKTIPIQYTIDRDTLNQYFFTLKKPYQREVQNATIIIEDGTVRIEPETTGQKVNTAKLELALIHSLENLENQTITLPIVSVEPSIKSDHLLPTRELTKTIISQPVSLRHEQNTYTITREQITGWLGFREFRPEGDTAATTSTGSSRKYVEVYLQNNEIIEHLEKEVASQINQEPKESKVIHSKNKTQVLQAGQDGKKMDILKTLAMIQEKLLLNEERVIDLPVETTTAEEVPSDIPVAKYTDKKHIIVSLKKQLAFAFEGTELMFVTKVSTGVTGHATPKGEYKVYAKTAKQKMSGPGYYLPNVPWILWYNGDYSLHGTYWHNNFGTPMSHGCTNLAIDDAKWFFEWAEVGTPVMNVD